jgi:glycosyltransferase involved in cell wall biosynthesis
LKPRVIFLLPDPSAVSARTVIGAIVDSPMGEEFEFSSMPQWSPQRTSPRAIVFSDPITWNRLPLLVRLRMGRGSGKLVVVDHHHSEGYEYFNVPMPTRLRTLLRLGYALADRVVAVSHNQQDWMRRVRLVRKRKVALIRPAPNLDALFALPQREPGKPLVIGTHGFFDRQGGFDLLLQAIKDIPADRARFIVGGFGPEEEMLRAMGSQLAHVEFCGEVRDTVAFLDRCDAVVIPSRWEPWGILCLEARAAGKPAIVSRIDGLVEQVGDCGLLVQPDDVEALVNTIGTFAAQSPETLLRWGEHGRGSAKGVSEKFVRKWRELLRS